MKDEESTFNITNSHLKAIEYGVPLLVSQRWTFCAQFAFLAISILLLLTISHITGEPETLYILGIMAITAIITFSISNAIVVKGQLRLKTILGKPHYIDPAKINHIWYPLGPKMNILMIVYRIKYPLPLISIITVPAWIRYAENIKLLLDHTQGPDCIMRKPEL